MKILKTKTHQDLLETIELLTRDVTLAEKRVKDLEYSTTQLSQVIDKLEKDRLYVNFIRDDKGRLHPIKVKDVKLN